MQADALGRALHEGTQFGLMSGCRCHCSELMGGSAASALVERAGILRWHFGSHCRQLRQLS